MKRWLVKVRHYRGGESVIGHCDSRAAADATAAARNARYQTDATYVEENIHWKPDTDGVSS